MSAPLNPGSTPPVWLSPLHTLLSDAGAAFAPCGDGMIAERVPRGSAGRARHLGIADLSPRPRFGVKGPGALAWLAAAAPLDPEAAAADANNRCRTHGQVTVARLSPAEAFLYPAADTPAADDAVGRLAERHDEDAPDGCYRLPRRDSHAWFRIVGAEAPAFFARLCAVDLRAERFAGDAVAQTSVALTSAIVARHNTGTVPAYDLFADTASARYLWEVFVEVADALGGGPVGYADLRALTP